jgi:hypothetical protein
MDNLTDRTVKLIEQSKKIVLKRKNSYWYLHQWTNIAAGPNHAHWGLRPVALEFHNLKWAFAIAKLYDCKVVSCKT